MRDVRERAAAERVCDKQRPKDAVRGRKWPPGNGVEPMGLSTCSQDSLSVSQSVHQSTPDSTLNCARSLWFSQQGRRWSGEFSCVAFGTDCVSPIFNICSGRDNRADQTVCESMQSNKSIAWSHPCGRGHVDSIAQGQAGVDSTSAEDTVAKMPLR